MSVKRLVAAVLPFCLMPFAGTVYGQDFPTKPVRILTSAPGSTSDTVARAIGAVMSERLGQQVISENAPGRSGALAARAQPDGYTLLIDGKSLWIGPLMQPDLPFTVADFAPVSQVTTAIYLLAVHPTLPVNSARELIAYAKARPGKLHYGAASVGSGGHLGTELFAGMAGIKIVHVPYKSVQMFTALVAGEIQLAFVSGTEALPMAKTGKLKILGVASKQPSPLAPGVPTIDGTGLPGFELTQASGMFAPVKTPAARVSLLSQEVQRALGMPDVQQRIMTLGLESKGSTPQEFAAMLKSDIDIARKQIQDLGLGKKS